MDGVTCVVSDILQGISREKGTLALALDLKGAFNVCPLFHLNFILGGLKTFYPQTLGRLCMLTIFCCTRDTGTLVGHLCVLRWLWSY